MESLKMHDLTAAYALDALDADEAREYEQHLATCESCRELLAQLGGVEDPCTQLVRKRRRVDAEGERTRGAARAERPNIVPLRPRWIAATTAIAAVAAVAAIGFGIWSASLSSSLERERSARQKIERLLADPNSTTRPISGKAAGTLVVSSRGEAALIVSGLAHAPSGKTYEAWVIANGKPRRAGTFAGGGVTTALSLERNVPTGAQVAVTLEHRPGVDKPTGPILLSSKPI